MAGLEIIQVRAKVNILSTRKWRETFLKTGLPLEHLVITRLSSIGWNCEPRFEYVRPNRKGEPSWFELDAVAYSPPDQDRDLSLLIECKYHDDQRSWFFLPCDTIGHLAQYSALSAGGDLEADVNVLHYAPYVPLRKKNKHTLISLAPKSVWGATVSMAGAREENSIKEALEQIGFAFVPFCLDRLYSFCTFRPQAVIPAIITSARLYRLRSSIRDVRLIRDARGPEEIADELPWTWCYYAPRGQLLVHNSDRIDEWKDSHSEVRIPGLDSQLANLWAGPHWVMVITIDALEAAINEVNQTFLALSIDKDYGRLERAVNELSAQKRKRYKEHKK